MRKLIVSNIMSLDGYYEGPGKNVMDLFAYRQETYPMDESFDAYNAERLRAAGALLLGRTTYDGFKGYWPPVADDPGAAPIEKEISRLNNEIDKVVVSDSLTESETDPWRNTRIVRRADAHQWIRDFKLEAGKELLVLGSRTLWSDLLANHLVDELHLMIAPVVIGGGTPVFSDQPRHSLLLADTRTWDGSGIVLARYVLPLKT